MLAAVTGLAYTAGSLLRVESYMAYLLPLPVILSALRSGPLPALKTLTTACLLLLGALLLAPLALLLWSGGGVGGGEGAGHVCRAEAEAEAAGPRHSLLYSLPFPHPTSHILSPRLLPPPPPAPAAQC